DRERSILAYLRLSPSPRPPVPPSFVVVICNFTPVPRPGYRVGVPEPGDYAELLNSDRRDYGGSGVENPAPLPAEAVPWHGLRRAGLDEDALARAVVIDFGSEAAVFDGLQPKAYVVGGEGARGSGPRSERQHDALGAPLPGRHVPELRPVLGQRGQPAAGQPA